MASQFMTTLTDSREIEKSDAKTGYSGRVVFLYFLSQCLFGNFF